MTSPLSAIRNARYRNLTAMWLALHQVPSAGMWMRGRTDPRPDVEVKASILATIRRRYRAVAAWDDRPEVCELWQREGLEVHVVPGWVDARL